MTDREEIQELMATYAYTIDKRDYEGLRGCFSNDAVAVYRGHSNSLSGAETILAHMKLALDPLDETQHIFSNFIIRVDGDSARLTCDVLAQHVRHAATGGAKFLAGGKYEVDARRISGKWKMQRVSAGEIWGEGNKNLLPKA